MTAWRSWAGGGKPRRVRASRLAAHAAGLDDTMLAVEIGKARFMQQEPVLAVLHAEREKRERAGTYDPAPDAPQEGDDR